MKLVVDTNVVVSAVVSKKGHAAKIRQSWRRGTVQLVTSPAILAEVQRVLSYPHIQKRHQWSRKRVTRFVKRLRTKALVVTREKPVVVIKEDWSDNMFLSCAVAAQADAIVSGDQHLTVLGSFRGIPILKPRECAARIAAREQ